MSIQKQLGQTANLLSAVDAVRNWRAAALMLSSLLLSGLVGALATVVGGQVHITVGLLFFLLALAVFFYGANAAGIMLMDEAQGGTSRPMLAAVFTSLSIGHRLILVLLLVLATYIVGTLVIALLLLICKIPGIGPLLFAFVFPISVVTTGIAIFAIYAVILPLVAPAVWSGATTMQALSRLAAIARHRIVVVILSVLVLLLICGVVGGIILSIMLTGTAVTSAMSAGIIGIGGMNLSGAISMLGMPGSGFGGSVDSGHLTAGAFGWGVVMAVAFTLPYLVFLRGSCQIYLANIQGVNVEGMEQQIRGTLNTAKRQASEIKAKGETIAAQQAQRFDRPNNLSPVASGPLSPQHKCRVCSAPCLSDDAFCGTCGHKLV